MGSKTVEVELDNGYIRAVGNESLPPKAHGFLTFLDTTAPTPAKTCAELADHWDKIPRLSSDEALAFAEDIEKGRATLPPVIDKWD